jgi:hypothetical protein
MAGNESLCMECRPKAQRGETFDIASSPMHHRSNLCNYLLFNRLQIGVGIVIRNRIGKLKIEQNYLDN